MTLLRFIRNTLVVCGKSYVNRGDGRIGSKWQRRCRQILHDQAFVAWKVSCYEARNINNHAYVSIDLCENICRYKRVFCVGTKAITTLNPTTHEITNQVKIDYVHLEGFFTYHVLILPLKWAYNEFAGIAPSTKANNEFIISMKKGKKTNTMTFSTDHRMDLLTEALVSICVSVCVSVCTNVWCMRAYICVHSNMCMHMVPNN